MNHNSIVVRLGPSDTGPVRIPRASTKSTDIHFVDGDRRLGFGLGQAIDELSALGISPSEKAVDLALLAAAVTAADTRISRAADAQDAWTREIDLLVPVQDVGCWDGLRALLVRTLNFLTGDRWDVHFRARAPGHRQLALPSTRLRTTNPTVVSLFSGGLDSFIGAIDLLAQGQVPMLVSHYWDGTTSTHQNFCARELARHFNRAQISHIRARVGFPTNTVAQASVEDTLRGRSFLFFALAAMAADAIGGDMVIQLPENGLISLNVPLDPLRIGALSTRTTHPYYIGRYGELLQGLGLRVRLHNPYAFKTKGQMARDCAEPVFLRDHAKHTMSCSSPGARRYDPDPTQRSPKHCGRCVPCLIRRAAIREAWGTDDTPYRIADLSAQVLDTNKAEGEHVRSFQLMLSRLTNKPSRARFDILRPGPLIDHPDRLQEYERVYVEGMQEVGRLLRGVRARPS